MEIEIYSDVVCPWCYVGKRRLDAALATFDGEVTLRWRAFQLDPDAPRDPRPLLGRLGQRLGGDTLAREAIARVSELGLHEGIQFNFEVGVAANTFDAHRLLWFADQPEAVFFGAMADTQPALAECLHRAHFTDGLDVGSHNVLTELAVEVGLDSDRVRRLLESTEGTADVRAQIAMAHDLGIRSVPTFVLAGTYGVTGAQDASVLRSALEDVARRDAMVSSPTARIPTQRTAPACEDDAFAA